MKISYYQGFREETIPLKRETIPLDLKPCVFMGLSTGALVQRQIEEWCLEWLINAVITSSRE